MNMSWHLTCSFVTRASATDDNAALRPVEAVSTETDLVNTFSQCIIALIVKEYTTEDIWQVVRPENMGSVLFSAAPPVVDATNFATVKTPSIRTDVVT